MKNRLCESFGIEFPIFAFSHCRDVVAAVTNAGGMGVLGTLVRSPSLAVDILLVGSVPLAGLTSHLLVRRVVDVVAGDRRISDALDAVEPADLPRIRNSGLGAAQALDPPVDPDMLFADALPLDASVDYEGDIPASPRVLKEFGDKYRKIRNTCRILVGNLYDFDPALDMVPIERLEPVVLTGEIPDPRHIPHGCRFHPRCPALAEGRADKPAAGSPA